MAKVLPLEGPHKHHHKHGKDASVASNKKLPKEHWEMHYDTCPKGSITPASAFLPQRGRDRPQPHVKVNETDH